MTRRTYQQAPDSAPRRWRILHCLCRIGSGGVEQRRLLLAHGLPKDRYEHLVICQDTHGALPARLREAGWPIEEIGPARHILDPGWHNRAARIAREFRPDLIHGAVFEGVALASVLGLRFPRARVISEETSDPQDRRWTGNLLMRGLALRSDLVIGVSPAVVDYLRITARIPQRKLRLINNAVASHRPPDPPRLARLRAEFRIAEGQPVIGSVGRVLDGHKRFSDIIRALPAIREGFPLARLLVVGDGPDQAALRELAGSLGVADALIWAGYQGSARDFYHLMDVFVLASAREAFGLVLVEAMLAGVPIVATEVGGIPFVLEGGACGTLVPPFRPERLADAIVAILAEKPLRERLTAAGQARAHSAFSAERYCSEVDGVYRYLLPADSQREPAPQN